jgi:hypothetical protein
MSARRRSRFVLLAVVLGIVLSTLAARRRGYSGLGGNTIVRCSKGHLFTTIWIPGASIKSIRLGPRRFQRCPVGRHWALVRPIKDADLTDTERRSATEHRDLRVP